MKDLELYKIPSLASMLDALEQIERNRSRCVFITEGDKVVGVLSEGDALRALISGVHLRTQVASVMKPSFRYLRERSFEQACRLVRKHLFTLVPIVDEEFRLTDVITLGEVLDYLESRAADRLGG